MSQIPQAVRAAVLDRDSSRCRFCGRPTTEIHHIVYRSQGGRHEVANLMVLCGTHHALVHSSKQTWMPILLATLKFQEKGMNLSVPQVQRWLGQHEEHT
jgi:5-methylcytosine-specific restriction endonuclease McrA